MAGYHYRGHGGSALTDRELEVLALAADDLTDVQIARRLDVTAETVRSHMKRIRHRLDVCSRTGAVAKAMRAGVLS